MKLANLFKKSKAPQNGGKEAVSSGFSSEEIRIENKLYLEFPDLDGQPTFELVSSLTIGSEVGDVILNHESIASRHCTLTMNQDVISIMDHNGATGTFINKKQLDPGKIFILQDKDKVKLGELSMKIVFQEIEVPVLKPASMSKELFEEVKEEEEEEEEESTQDISPELIAQVQSEENLEKANASDENNTDELTDELTLDIPKPEIDEALTLSDIPVVKVDLIQVEENLKLEEKIEEEVVVAKTPVAASGGNKLVIANGSNGFVHSSTSALTRVIAIIIEVLLINIIIVLLSAFNDFRNIFNLIQTDFMGIFKPLYNTHVSVHMSKLTKEVPALPEMGKDIVSFFDKNPEALYGIWIFIAMRVVAPLFLGVSLGQALVGVRASGNFAGKRLLGVVHGIIGFVTLPFLFFDITTLFSRRSFKEMITFTKLETPSNIKTILASIIFTTLFATLLLVTPLFQGLELRNPINSTHKEFKAIKIDLAAANHVDNSRILKIKTALSGEYYDLPLFRFHTKRRKNVLTSELLVINKNNLKTTAIYLKKVFSLKKVLAIGINGNFMAELKFPQIVSFVKDVSHTNKNFHSKKDKKMVFANEVAAFFRVAMGLSVEKIVDHVKEYGPFIKGFVDFRDAIGNVTEHSITRIESKMLGDTAFIIVHQAKNTVLIPIQGVKTNMYVLQGNMKTKELENVFAQTKWYRPSKNIISSEKMSSLHLIDELSRIDELENLDQNFYQNAYELLYKKAKVIMTLNKKLLNKKLIISYKSILNLLDHEIVAKADDTKTGDSMGNPTINGKRQRVTLKDKFYQNLADMIKAVEDNDQRYFGINRVKTAGL